MAFVQINDDPDVLALYDEMNGVVHLMSDALGNRTVGVNSLEEAKARYSDYVTESKTTEELGSEIELRTDLQYEYSAAFKSVRIYQIFENSPTVSELVLVANERADSEDHAEEVFEKFRSENRDPILPRVDADPEGRG